jgi:hypothetical protein
MGSDCGKAFRATFAIRGSRTFVGVLTPKAVGFAEVATGLTDGVIRVKPCNVMEPLGRQVALMSGDVVALLFPLEDDECEVDDASAVELVESEPPTNDPTV